jgi:threonyl-tRNA synthetase
LRKVPYLVIIGDKEVSEQKITVRKRSGENISPLTIDDFITLIKDKIINKSNEL